MRISQKDPIMQVITIPIQVITKPIQVITKPIQVITKPISDIFYDQKIYRGGL